MSWMRSWQATLTVTAARTFAVLLEDTGEVWIYTNEGNGTHFQRVYNSRGKSDRAHGGSQEPNPASLTCWWQWLRRRASGGKGGQDVPDQ